MNIRDGAAGTCGTSGAILGTAMSVEQQLKHQIQELYKQKEVLANQIADLLAQLEATKAGRVYYKTKFETLSELFDRFLNSTKQEKY